MVLLSGVRCLCFVRESVESEGEYRIENIRTVRLPTPIKHRRRHRIEERRSIIQIHAKSKSSTNSSASFSFHLLLPSPRDPLILLREDLAAEIDLQRLLENLQKLMSSSFSSKRSSCSYGGKRIAFGLRPLLQLVVRE